MNKYIITLIGLTLLFSSCKKRVRPLQTTDLNIHMLTEVDGTNITLGLMNHVNASGNRYSIDILKYYISNVIFTREDGLKFKLNRYDLIDIEAPESSIIPVNDIPEGTYTSIQLSMGVDSIRNHTGAQDGDLDPVYGMAWPWNTGYIFYKHEGQYMKNDSTSAPLRFHFGTDPGYSTVTIPLHVEITTESKAIYLVFDVNKMYNDPAINFVEDNDHQSVSANDARWIDNMRINTSDAFSFDHVE